MRKSLRRAHIVKLNDQELHQVSRLLNLGVGTEETLAKRLLNEYGLLLVSVTRGALGSILVSQSQTVEHSGFRVKIADAIGAGDAFTACLAHYYLRGHSLEDLSDTCEPFCVVGCDSEGRNSSNKRRPVTRNLSWGDSLNVERLRYQR